MHKTVSIDMNGMLFQIEEGAYQKLSDYLSAIRNHFASSADGDEIASDIESRIAEEFASKLNARKKSIVQKDVDDVIRKMGTVDDFKQFDAGTAGSRAEDDTNERLKRARLYRDPDDRILGGVAAGIAHYFNIDPIVTRLIFGLSVFMGGFGIVLYILLWIIVPEAKTTGDKMEMAGNAVTLTTLTERIKEVGKEGKEAIRKGTFRKVLEAPFVIIRRILTGIGRFLKALMPVLGRIVGIVITIAASLAIAGLTMSLIVALTNGNSPELGFPLASTVGAGPYMVMAFSAYFLAFVPVILVLLVGASLASMKNAFSSSGMIGLFGLWIIALIVGGVTAFNASPAIQAAADRYQEENGKLSTKDLPFRDFARISAGSNTIVHVKKGTAYSVRVTGPTKTLSGTVVNLVENPQGNIANELAITRRQMSNLRPRFCLFCGDSPRVVVDVTMPQLNGVELTGVATADIEGFKEKACDIHGSGGSELVMNASCDNMTVELDGVARAILNGTGTSLQFTANGGSELNASKYSVKTMTVDMTGVAHAEVDVSDSITGEMTGGSELWYEREPKTHDIDLSGVAGFGGFHDEEENF